MNKKKRAGVVSPEAIRADANMTAHVRIRARAVSVGPGVRAHNITRGVEQEETPFPTARSRPRRRARTDPEGYSGPKIPREESARSNLNQGRADNKTTITYYLPTRARARAS